MDRFRWGIVGFGWVARDYMAPAIRASGGTLAALCDPAFAAHGHPATNGARCYADLTAMLADGGLDALYVATPNHLHAEVAEQAAARGIPILCEKPLAENAASLERIAAVADGVRMGAAFDQRHHPAHAVVRERIASGDLGTVTAIRIVYCCWVDPQWSRGTGDNWRADGQCAGGGAVLDLAPHGLDLAQFLTGEPVGNMTMRLQRRVHDYAVEDGGMTVGATPSGILFSSHTSYNWPEELPRRRLEIAGTGAMIVASDTMGQEAGGHMTRIDARDGTKETVAFDTEASPFTRQAEAFARFARTGEGDFDIQRDIAAARRFFAAFEEARACL